jgi:GDP/UDP-N,N'-diacetylbacillosamine 2-epimerase (hydrolysing)
MSLNICIVTGSRAEYGLFYPLIKRLNAESGCNLNLVVTGAHLSSKYGNTIDDIRNDGFEVAAEVDINATGGDDLSTTNSIGKAVAGLAEAYRRIRPDMVVLLGDRYETFSAAISALILKIPICHVHGGEVTVGAFDDALRHSITKMSALHFVSTEEYRRRVVQLGEDPERVFNVGAIGLDNILNEKLDDISQLETDLNLKLSEGSYALATYHPVTLCDEKDCVSELKEFLNALEERNDIRVIFTRPNADTYGKVVDEVITNFVKSDSKRFSIYTSLGCKRYLSLMKYVDFVIGNSSSGIIETPSFGIPTINVGDRQDGRVRAESIIDCGAKKEDVLCAIDKAMSDSFKGMCRQIKSPYGDGKASDRIASIIFENLNKIKVRKTFYDIDISALV